MQGRGARLTGSTAIRACEGSALPGRRGRRRGAAVLAALVLLSLACGPGAAPAARAPAAGGSAPGGNTGAAAPAAPAAPAAAPAATAAPPPVLARVRLATQKTAGDAPSFL